MLSILIPRFLMKSGEHLTSISWVPAVGQVAARRDVQSGIWVTQSPMLAFCIWLVATSIEIQTKIKGELSSLEQLEWTAAVNNGCSGFYFPISEFPKSQTQIISSLCFFSLFTKWSFTWGTRFCWLKCHFYWNHPFNYYLKMLTVGSGWCCFYSNKTKDIHVPVTIHKKGVASLLITKG